MELKTPQLGTLYYEDEEVIYFPEGLYGFEQVKRFLLIAGKTDTIFNYLQSIEDTHITFILANPKDIVENYVLMITPGDMEKVKAESEADLADYVIVTVPKNLQEISVNLLGPILLNKRLNIGAQVISQNDQYNTKHKILKQVQAKVC